MSQNIFFEGPVRSGKSTALRKALLPHFSEVGGFVVQRLVGSNGHPAAYRLAGITDPAAFLAVDAPYTGGETDIFLRLPSREFDSAVFEAKGIELLDRSQDKRILLLDEIGGLELLIPSFRDRLISLLQGETPCVGIMKERQKSREALVYNDLLRSMVSVIPVTSEHLEEISVRLKRLPLFQKD